MTPEEEKLKVKLPPTVYLNLQCPDCKKTGKGLYDVEKQEVFWVEKDTNEWEKELRELAKNHQLNHGLKSAENASPKMIWGLGYYEAIEVMIPFISQLLQQREKALVEKIEKLKKDKDVLLIPYPFVKGMDVSVHYNKALQDCLSLLENK